jgi:hypothetical protein
MFCRCRILRWAAAASVEREDRVDSGLQAARVSERENGVEFFAEERGLLPQVAEVHAADSAVVRHQLQRCQDRDAQGLRCDMGRVAPLPAGQVGEPERDEPAARAQQSQALPLSPRRQAR